jgi:hypothetical protein
MAKGRHNTYTPEQLAWIEANRSMLRPEAHKAFVARFGRPEITLGAYAGLCKRNGWTTGRTGHFGTEGATPGHRFPKGSTVGEATRFKKGDKPVNKDTPLGHERLSEDGYVMVKVAETNPWTGADVRYRLKHLVEWEKANGPVPEGMCLKCLGDRADASPANWTMVSRGVLPRLLHRGYDDMPDDFKPTVLAVSRLEQAVYSAEHPRAPGKTGRKRKERT